MCGGETSESYDKSLVSRFRIDTFAQAEIDNFCIMVDRGDEEVGVAKSRGGISWASGGVASTRNHWDISTSRTKIQYLVFPIKDMSTRRHNTIVRE